MASQAQSERPDAQDRQGSQFAGFRRVLTNRHFLLLWLAQLISQTVLNAANFGIVVLVQESARSPLLTGLALIAFLLPGVPFSALAGVIVDRMKKRQVLWVSNLLRMVMMLLICASLLFNRTALWPLFALTFLSSLISQFFTPAEGASIPLLVGEQELMPALSLFNITITLAQAIGFLLLGRVVAAIFPNFTLHIGSVALAFQSMDMLFVVLAFLYALCAVLILCIPLSAFESEQVKKTRGDDEPFELRQALRTIWHDIVESWKTIRADHLLFFAVIQLSFAGIIMQVISALAPTFVQQVLHRPAADMAVVLAPAGIGLVGASFLLPRMTSRIGKAPLSLGSMIVLAFGFMLMASSQWLVSLFDPRHGNSSPLLFWLTLLVVFVLGVAVASANVPAQTLMQERSPEEGRARILSLQLMLFNAGTIPILLFASAFAQFIGLHPAIFLISACILLASWWGIFYIRKSDRRKPQD